MIDNLERILSNLSVPLFFDKNKVCVYNGDTILDESTGNTEVVKPIYYYSTEDQADIIGFVIPDVWSKYTKINSQIS